MALLLALTSSAGAEATKEYQLKAVFLYNFAQFIEWPASAFTSDAAPMRIGVLGDDPFGSSLDEVVRNESVRGRRFAVSRSARPEDLKDCQMIYVARSEKARVGEILAALAGRPVLTVSDLDGFAALGGMIRFYVEGNKIRFEINQGSAQEHGLKPGSQLLGLGKIVATSGDAERK
jgi:hypothetical protein